MPILHATFAVMSITGCGSEDSSARAVLRFDSAGVRVAVNTVDPELIPVVQLGRARATIGQSFGDVHSQFNRIVAGEARPDGTIVVADQGDLLIKVFARDGNFLFAVGGEGGGPGELKRISSFQILGNGDIVVYDRSARRLTQWGPDGRLQRTVPVQPSGAGVFDAVHLVSDGGAIAIGLWPTFGENEPTMPGVRTYDAVAVKLDEAFGVEDTIAVFPGNELYYFAREGYRFARFTSPLFARRAVFNFGGECVYAALSGTLSVGRFCRGRNGLIQRFDWPSVEDHLIVEREEFAAEGVRLWNRSGVKVTREEFLNTYGFDIPERKPAAGALLVDEVGFVWLAEYYHTVMPAVDWLVFDPTGAVRARLHLPQAWRILWVGNDEILALERDEMDVERIAVYDVPVQLR